MYIGFDNERGLMLDELTIKGDNTNRDTSILNKSNLMESINGKNQDITDEKKTLKKKNLKEI